MPACAKALQQPDGTLLLALDPSNTNLSTCAYLVEDGTTNAWRELGNLSLENAQVISFSVGAVWAVAWGFKAIGRTLSSAGSTNEME